MRKRKILPLILVLMISLSAGLVAFECPQTNTTPCAPFCSGGGGGGGPTPTSTPAPPLDPFKFYWYHGGEYSYGDTCTNDQVIDPITVVFRHNGVNTHTHNQNHGLGTGDSNPQRFWEDGLCLQSDFSDASNDGVRWCLTIACPESRWHMRGEVANIADTDGGTWAVGTPHKDEAFDKSCWHAVTQPYAFDDSDFPPGPWDPNISGFTAGRIWVTYQYVNKYGHHLMGSEFWGNVSKQQQCNGDYTGSDGWVNFIDISSTDQ